MAAPLVNMDALIPREDFEASSTEVATQPSILSTTMKITDLGPESLIYTASSHILTATQAIKRARMLPSERLPKPDP